VGVKFDLKDIIRRKEDMESRSYPTYPDERNDIAEDALQMLLPALARIEDLESRLCESEAISHHNFQRYEAAIGEGHIAGFDHRVGWSDLPEERRNAIIEVHREMRHCEGKL